MSRSCHCRAEGQVFEAVEVMTSCWQLERRDHRNVVIEPFEMKCTIQLFHRVKIKLVTVSNS